MKYALEPIVPISGYGRSGRTEWWELLYRGGRRSATGQLCATPAEWRDWYAMIPAILDSVVARHANVRLSVNVSTYQLLDSQIRENLIEVARCGAHLALEWTEDPLAPDPLPGKRAAANFLSDLRNRFRVVVGIDDMGAGDDGIGRMILLDRSPDFVKLDGSVLHAVRARCGHEALVAEQIRAFRKLRVQVVGEHIENVGQLQLARRLGLNYAQGFLFTRRLDGPLVAASVGVAGARDSVNSAESAHCGDEAFGRRRAPS